MWPNELDRILSLAVSVAMELSHELITAEHLLFVLLADDKVLRFARSIGVNTGSLRARLFSHLRTELSCITINDKIGPYGIRLAVDVENIVEKTLLQIGILTKSAPPASLVMLAEILQDKNSFASFFLRSFDITIQKLIRYVCSAELPVGSSEINPIQEKELAPREPKIQKIPFSNREVRGSGESSHLDQFCVDLNAKASSKQH